MDNRRNSPDPCPSEMQDGSFDAGLWALEQIAIRGEVFSLEEIAIVCGCSHE